MVSVNLIFALRQRLFIKSNSYPKIVYFIDTKVDREIKCVGFFRNKKCYQAYSDNFIIFMSLFTNNTKEMAEISWTNVINDIKAEKMRAFSWT